MKEKDIIENIIDRIDETELPEKPLQGVLREMRSSKATGRTKKKPFYMRKSFVSACACVILAVVMIPAGVMLNAITSSKMSAGEPNLPIPTPSADVAPSSPHTSYGTQTTTPESVSLSTARELGVIAPDELFGKTPDCTLYKNGDEIVKIELTYGEIAKITASPTYDKESVNGATNGYTTKTINGINVFYKDSSSTTDIRFTKDGFSYEYTVLANSTDALATVDLFK